MKHQATRDLFAYWNALRGDRAAPDRSDIDPTAIRNVIADTFMLDLDVAERFPFRLAGTRVNGLFDADLKGRSFLDLWRPEERRNIAGVVLTVADGGCPIVTGARAAPGGHPACSLEALFLPLRRFGKTHARILGIITPASEPTWFGLLPLEPLALRSLRIVDDPDTALATSSPLQAASGPPIGRQSVAPIASARSPSMGRDDARRGRPHLRLIEGGLGAT